jgi:hypothetical protein
VVAPEAVDLRRIETQWKSDVDKKLDKLVKFMELMTTREATLTTSVTELVEILNTGKGAVNFLFLLAKVSAAIGVVGGAIYAAKAWITRV